MAIVYDENELKTSLMQIFFPNIKLAGQPSVKLKASKPPKQEQALEQPEGCVKEARTYVGSSSVKSCRSSVKSCSSSTGRSNEQNPRVTSDGFKIISESELLEDDSDVEDAFVPGDDKDENASDAKYTNDGFKIVSSIPEDDSDVSDAFDEEGSDEELDTSDQEIEDIKSHAELSSKLPDGKENQSTQPILEMPSIGAKLPDGEENNSALSNVLVSATELPEDSKPAKKRKRGIKNKNKSATTSLNSQLPPAKKKNKKKKNKKAKVELSQEDIEIIKSRYRPVIHKAVEKLGLDWATLESKKMREKRELSKLPQPKQIPNCRVYLQKCPGTGKVLTIYDYSGRRQSTSAIKENPLNKAKPKQSPQVSGLNKATTSEEEKHKIKREMKMQHLEELRGIKRSLTEQVVNKTLDPATRTQNMLAKIERLGGSKVKKPYVNYKVYMEQQKAQKLAEEQKKQNLRDIGMRDLVKKKRRARKRRNANDVPGWGSLGGRFTKDGVRVVSKREKANIDRS